MALVADHDELITFLVELGDFHVHLGHQRAGGVENLEATPFCLPLDGFAHAVGREHQSRTCGHIVELFDEDGAAILQVIDHIGVVHDLVPHIDGAAKLGQCPVHDFDGAVHPCAKTPWFRQNDFAGHDTHSTPISCTSKVTGWPASGWLKSNSTACSAGVSPRSCSTTPANWPWPSGVGNCTTSPTL